jgi:hypothetical protein
MPVPRYPEIQVSTRSPNPIALVAMVRQALRKARVDRSEIEHFSIEALRSRDPQEQRRVCGHWVRVA